MINADLSNHRWIVVTLEDMEFVQKKYIWFKDSIDMLEYKNLIGYIE
jgi:hypothetical protein